MKRFLMVSLTLIILGCLIYLAIRTQDIGEMIALIRSARKEFYALSCILTIGTVLLTATNLLVLLSRITQAPSWWRIVEVELLSLFGVYYTPAGSGGIAFVTYMLKKEKVPAERSLCSLFVDKLVTVSIALGSFIILTAFGIADRKIALDTRRAGMIIVGILATFALLFTIPSAKRRVHVLMENVACFRNHWDALLINVVITIAVYTLNALQFLVAFAALRVPAPAFSRLLASYGSLALLGYLPFTISGAGVIEAAAVVLWRGSSENSEQIIAVVLMTRVFALTSSLFLPALAYAIRFWRFEPRGPSVVQEKR
jgi:glycosyltransferase 2 family protein